MRHYYLEDILGWDRQIADDFLNAHLGQIYHDMQPKEQAIEVINHLKKEHELILITSRNRQFPEVEEVTVSWLKRNGLFYDRLILNTTSNMHFFNKRKSAGKIRSIS